MLELQAAFCLKSLADHDKSIHIQLQLDGQFVMKYVFDVSILGILNVDADEQSRHFSVMSGL